MKMTVCTPKHVFFLRRHSFDVTTAWNMRVGHVEYRKTFTVLPGKVLGDLSPIALDDVDLFIGLGLTRLACPSIEIRFRKTMVPVGRFGVGKSVDSLPQYLASPNQVRPPQMIDRVLIYAFRLDDSTWHEPAPIDW